MPKTNSASEFDNNKKRDGGTYTALPPTGWNCAASHDEISDEDARSGEENFTVLYDDGTMIIVSNGESYRGHLSANHTDTSISEGWQLLVKLGLVATEIHRTKFEGQYTIRLRELTDTEKDVLNEYNL